jgi:hypothetical protein
MEKQWHKHTPIEASPMPGVERGRLLLQIPASSIEIPAMVISYAALGEFMPKEEYHVTVVGKKTQERLLAEGVLDEVVDLLENTPPWNIISFDDIFSIRNIETDGNGNQVIEESIIQLVTLHGLDEMYDQIREVAGLDIPTPPAHITLFTKNADRGIGLYSNIQLAEYVTKRLV